VELNAQVLGISVDHIPCLKAWAKSLGGISFPLLSDFWPHGDVSTSYGVLRDVGSSERAIFILDKHGTIQYIDIHDVDDQPSNEVLFDEILKFDPNPSFESSMNESSVEEELPTGGIIMYCNSWCPDCKKARKYLSDNNIEYREVDVNKNKKAADQVREWANGNLVTPTFEIDGKIVVDWNQAEFEEAIR
jgi:glutaredoxin